MLENGNERVLTQSAIAIKKLVGKLPSVARAPTGNRPMPARPMAASIEPAHRAPMYQ